jgi:hypothetical protein
MSEMFVLKSRKRDIMHIANCKCMLEVQKNMFYLQGYVPGIKHQVSWRHVYGANIHLLTEAWYYIIA